MDQRTTGVNVDICTLYSVSTGSSYVYMCTCIALFHTHTHTQALLDGFTDHRAVENFISGDGRNRLQMDGDKIKVDVGTLRTKVLVQES